MIPSRTSWRQWVYRPQRLGWRRALFQVHLWIAITIGAYIVVISVSGSAVVFRRELNVWLVPRTLPTAGMRLTGDALRSAAATVYADRTITEILEPARADRPVLITVEGDGAVSERLFDPYAVRDLGEAFPPVLRAVEWLVDLHDNLLAGRIGRIVNGVGGALVTVLLLTGALIWWPGKAHWRRSVVVPLRTRRLVWHLHSFVGFWSFLLLLVWALTAVYFAFPEPFEATIDYFDDDPNDFERPGEAVLLALIRLHFGRFGGLEIRFLWVLLGLLPALLFVTGFLLWWRRVARPAWSALSSSPTPILAREAVSERDADRAV